MVLSVQDQQALPKKDAVHGLLAEQVIEAHDSS
jgi:hypothetical protein